MGLSEEQLMSQVTELTVKLDLETPDHLVKWAKKQGF
jgi:hypothetical protein